VTASDAAYEVLTSAGEPLHKDELTKRMIESGLWQSDGKTPAATVVAILGTEIAEQVAASRFVRRSVCRQVCRQSALNSLRLRQEANQEVFQSIIDAVDAER